MSKLLFIFPAEPQLWESTLLFFNRLCAFIDHEKFTRYWDESLYKSVRGLISGADSLSKGLRRLKVQEYTDYSYLPGLPGGTAIYHQEKEYTQTIYSPLIAAKISTDSTVVAVKRPEENTPGHFTLWVDGIQRRPINSGPFITDHRSANEWFAVNRQPPRVFNHDDERHTVKEYRLNNLTVSPLNIPKTEIDHGLHHALGAVNERRLIYHHKERGLYLIFSDERRTASNGGSPVYHGHQLDENDKKEVNRLPGAILKKLKDI